MALIGLRRSYSLNQLPGYKLDKRQVRTSVSVAARIKTKAEFLRSKYREIDRQPPVISSCRVFVMCLSSGRESVAQEQSSSWRQSVSIDEIEASRIDFLINHQILGITLEWLVDSLTCLLESVSEPSRDSLIASAALPKLVTSTKYARIVIRGTCSLTLKCSPSRSHSSNH